MAIDWRKTLNNIFYRSTKKTVTFTMDDIDQLNQYVTGLQNQIADLEALRKRDMATINELVAKGLSIGSPTSEKLGQFIEHYA